ncbi:hypothetical protein CVT24_006224 [Panaeolus cyanescens]|uniref:Uncharacterized protein n=1 Tax=Panaeolus cyanescens TaxID=181874 RepID=A0A409YEE6_9AGAR|nr:hypothetical protein CVT24_006224 [Panaeolus cyanescens]
MQSATPQMLSLPPSSSTTRIGTYVGIVGITAITAFGAWKAANLWREFQRSRELDQDTCRKQQNELKLLRISLDERQVEVEEKKKALKSTVEQQERLRSKLQEQERETETLKRQNRSLSEKVNQLSTANHKLEGELQRIRTEFEGTTDLLRRRTTELKGAQTFLTKADQIAGADVIRLVEELNAEVMQTAATMAEGVQIEEKKLQPGGKELESNVTREADARTEEYIGPRLTELLKTSEHHEDPILVQIALQAGMAAYVHWAISSWCFESQDDEHMLSEIYARVRETEEQAVSGRWRQLTRTHLQRMFVPTPDLSVGMVEMFTNVFLTAGLKGDAISIQQRLINHFMDRIQLVCRLAQQLNKHIGEGVTSCDLEVLFIADGAPFHSHTMEDSVGSDGIINDQEHVVCTTDLGLVRAEKISGTVGDWHEAVLLKPKVVLQSGLAGLIGEQAMF